MKVFIQITNFEKYLLLFILLLFLAFILSERPIDVYFDEKLLAEYINESKINQKEKKDKQAINGYSSKQEKNLQEERKK